MQSQIDFTTSHSKKIYDKSNKKKLEERAALLDTTMKTIKRLCPWIRDLLQENTKKTVTFKEGDCVIIELEGQTYISCIAKVIPKSTTMLISKRFTIGPVDTEKSWLFTLVQVSDQSEAITLKHVIGRCSCFIPLGQSYVLLNQFAMCGHYGDN